MRRFLYYVLLATFLFGCTNDSIEPEDYKIVQFEQNDLLCSNLGETFEISFATNGQWTISVNCDWCTLSASKGSAGSQKVSVTVGANSTNEDREAIVTIRCGNDYRSFTIQQKQSNVITTSLSDIGMGAAGGTASLVIQSNVDYTYKTSKDWVTVSKNEDSKSVTNTTWTINVEQNKSTSERTAAIVFYGEGCSNTVRIVQGSAPDDYDFEEDGLFYKISSIGSLTVTLVGGENVYSGEIHIPTTITHNGKSLSVYAIGANAFYNSNVTKVTIGDNVSRIEYNAFQGSSIECIRIPASVGTLYERSFDNCTKLSEVYIEDASVRLKFFYSSSYVLEFFVNCPIKKLYIGRNIEHSSNSGFADLSNTEEIVLGPYVTSIDERLLAGASKITSLIIPSSVKFMGIGAFDKCFNLKKLIFEDGEEILTYTRGGGSVVDGVGGNYINHSMFCDSPIEEVYIGRNFEQSSEINTGRGLINLCPVTKVTIGKNVTELVILSGLEELKKITIPSNVNVINSFDGCTNLNTIICENPTPPISNGYESVFPNKVYTEGTLFVPKGSVELYKSADVWRNFFNISSL